MSIRGSYRQIGVPINQGYRYLKLCYNEHHYIMTPEKINDLLFSLIGLFFAIGFRYIGKSAIEQRKRINRILPFPQPEKDFNAKAVVLTQIGFLLIGILFFLIGMAKFLS